MNTRRHNLPPTILPDDEPDSFADDALAKTSQRLAATKQSNNRLVARNRK